MQAESPTWQEAWHRGIVPQLSIPELEVLADALERDDPELIQGNTCDNGDDDDETIYVETIYGACAVGYCGWKARGIQEATALNSYFCELVDEAQKAFPGVSMPIQTFFLWFDQMPRRQMIEQLLPEVRKALAARREELISKE